MNIIAISGSTRTKSSNNSVIHFIQKEYKNIFNLELYDSIGELPHFNPDMDTDSPPLQVAEFRKTIAKADGVIICTPEYVFSIPGVLKNAIEWMVSTTIFSNKPLALIVAATSGEKALESLDLIMTTLESRLPNSSKLLIKGVRSKLDSEGILCDSLTINDVKSMCDSLILSINDKT